MTVVVLALVSMRFVDGLIDGMCVVVNVVGVRDAVVVNVTLSLDVFCAELVNASDRLCVAS